MEARVRGRARGSSGPEVDVAADSSLSKRGMCFFIAGSSAFSR